MLLQLARPRAHPELAYTGGQACREIPDESRCLRRVGIGCYGLRGAAARHTTAAQCAAAPHLAIASAARCAAIVPLRKAGAVEDVQRHLDACVRNVWGMFEAGPEIMMGIALAMNGDIDAGLRRIEERIARNEQQGYPASADWARLAAPTRRRRCRQT